MIECTVNGTPQSLDLSPDTPLLWALRDHLHLSGTKFGCGIAECGACTVLLNGNAVRSCQIPVSSVQGMHVTTIEGLDDPQARAVRAAWVAHQVPQCGYCQSGQIVSASALLHSNPDPSDADIDAFMSGNICRCGTYDRIRAAIHDAARALRQEA